MERNFPAHSSALKPASIPLWLRCLPPKKWDLPLLIHNLASALLSLPSPRQSQRKKETASSKGDVYSGERMGGLNTILNRGLRVVRQDGYLMRIWLFFLWKGHNLTSGMVDTIWSNHLGWVGKTFIIFLHMLKHTTVKVQTSHVHWKPSGVL